MRALGRRSAPAFVAGARKGAVQSQCRRRRFSPRPVETGLDRNQSGVRTIASMIHAASSVSTRSHRLPRSVDRPPSKHELGKRGSPDHGDGATDRPWGLAMANLSCLAGIPRVLGKLDGPTMGGKGKTNCTDKPTRQPVSQHTMTVMRNKLAPLRSFLGRATTRDWSRPARLVDRPPAPTGVRPTPPCRGCCCCCADVGTAPEQALRFGCVGVWQGRAMNLHDPCPITE